MDDSSIEEAAQRVMERTKQRREQLRRQDGNEENRQPADTALKPQSRDNSPPPPPLPSIPSPKIVDEDEERRTYRKSRFSALAQEQADWEYDTPTRKNKDDYRKGASPRRSIGETRPSILFSPAGGRSPLKEVSPLKGTKSPAKTQLETVDEASSNKRRMQFGDESARDSPLSSVHHETSSTVGAFTSKEVTSFADGERKEEEFESHSYIRRETRNTSSSSLLCSPKPFSTSVVNASHSPVRFTPTSSSPIRAEARMNIACTIPLDISSISPATHRVTPLSGPSGRHVLDTIYTSSPSQITPSTAKHFFAQLPSKSPLRLGNQQGDSPVRSAALSSAKATHIRRDIEMKIKKGEAGMPRATPSSLPSARPVSRIAVPQGAITPSIPAGVRTQWRGTSNTPVVAGADPSEKTVPDVRAANLASLKSRWEFSAATGTPLHPDKSERDLLNEAKKEAEKATYNKSGNNSVSTPRKKGREVGETSGDAARKSLTSSPVNKSPRLNHYRPEGMEEEGPLESGEEEDMMEEDEQEASRIIDKAFSFMEGQKSPFKSVASLEKVIEQTEDEEEKEDEEMKKKMERLKKEEEDLSWKKEQERLAREEELFKREKEKERERKERQREEKEKPKFTAPPPPEQSIREEEREEDASGKPLAHTISFYRKRKAEKKDTSGLETMDYRMPASSQEHPTVIGGQERTSEEEEEEMRAEEIRLLQSLDVQEQHVTQAKRALDFCSKTQFSGSREEVDAQRALLIAMETKRQLMQAIDDIRKRETRTVDGPRGAMRIGPISVQLVRDCMAHPDTVYYLIVLLRHGGQLTHTSLVTYDPAARTMGGKSTEVEFGQYLHLERLPPDFDCMVEVWALCTRREQIGHEDKYKLKGGTMKKKTILKRNTQVHNPKMKKRVGFALDNEDALIIKLRRSVRFRGSLKRKTCHEIMKESVFSTVFSASSSEKQQVMQTDGRRNEMPSFKLMGRTRLDINSAERRRFVLEDTCHPLEGTIGLKMKRYAMEKGDVLHRGFLSLYQRTVQGSSSWTRFWCVVENGEMKFWRSPEDETTKEWLVLIDLSTCADDGVKQEADQELCPFPNSFHVDVWVPRDGAQSVKQLEKLRVLMAADRKEDLTLWLDILNKTIRNLLLWTAKRNA